MEEEIRQRLSRLMKRGAGRLRHLADKISGYANHPSRLHNESDVDFLIRLSERPSWYMHRKRFLRIAEIVERAQ